MRLGIQSICLFTLGASCWLSQEAFSQQTITSGIRLYKDENERVASADYYTASSIKYAVRRGHAQLNEFLPLAQLHEFPHLESLMVPYGVELTSEDINHLSTLQSLVEISLGHPEVGSESVTIEGDLSKFGKFKRLEVLRLCKDKMKDEDLEFVASLPKITYIEFNGNTSGWGEEGPTATDRCADYLSRARTLKAICIRGGGKFTDKFISKLTEGLPDLEHLEVPTSDSTDESLRLLAKRCKKLNWLDISGRFTDAGVKHLQQAKNLKYLWLRSRSLNANCVRYVADLQHLQHLQLTVPSIEDEGVQVLANLRRLEILALRRPALTDEQFAMFRNHPTLAMAYINGSKLSNDEVVKVIETLPNLRHLQIGGNGSLQRTVDQALARKQASR